MPTPSDTSRNAALEEAAKAVDAMADNQERTNHDYPAHAQDYPSWRERVTHWRCAATAIRALQSKEKL